MEIPNLKLEPGDVILTRSPSVLSRIIRLAGIRRTGEARVSHAAIALGNMIKPPSCVEALWTVTISPLRKYLDQEIVVWRLSALSRLSRERIAIKALTRCNRLYAPLKLPLFLLDSIFRTYFFTRTFGITNYQVCSELFAWAVEKVTNEKAFGIGWRSVQPDTIDDWCRENPEKAKLVYSSLESDKNRVS